ncbi:hypothetical protein HELRODRAFT_161404 [Helobdella robusta]|uniref:E3 ubiquitin-protein ligase n=1 Tax=Helobdella robusta TaxID=6412 RepID=T1ERG1_HELRO|nr:hypothetical protein HELRODRAFT_161404 [Helobdella robusta]ESO02167.1 hypothetical protein HELRODRAFT_161404 [Helobdella robusta]
MFHPVIKDRSYSRRIVIPVRYPESYENLLRQDYILQLEDDYANDEDCSICLCSLNNFSDVVFLRKCKHHFHLHCLEQLYSFGKPLKCPYCRRVYKLKYGKCRSGVLETYFAKNELLIRFALRSFEFIFVFKNNEETRRVTTLLMKAWERQLLNTGILNSLTCSYKMLKLEVIKHTLTRLNVFENQLIDSMLYGADDCYYKTPVISNEMYTAVWRRKQPTEPPTLSNESNVIARIMHTCRRLFNPITRVSTGPVAYYTQLTLFPLRITILAFLLYFFYVMFNFNEL